MTCNCGQQQTRDLYHVEKDIDQYYIVCGQSAAWTTKKVQELIDQGYIPRGPLLTGNGEYVQNMVKFLPSSKL